jgi:hypothetical protein
MGHLMPLSWGCLHFSVSSGRQAPLPLSCASFDPFIASTSAAQVVEELPPHRGAMSILV